MEIIEYIQLYTNKLGKTEENLKTKYFLAHTLRRKKPTGYFSFLKIKYTFLSI